MQSSVVRHERRRAPQRVALASVLLAAVALAACDDGDEPSGAPQEERLVGHTVVPESLGVTEQRVASLRAPQGFRVTVFASDLGTPRMLAVGGDGTVYVTRQASGDVLALNDRDGDGVAEQRRTAAQGLELVHGITMRGSDVWLVAPTRLWRTTRMADGLFAPPTLLSSDLPPGGQHRARVVQAGPDGMLYISAGSTCNACEEPNSENATMMRANPDGSGRTVIARGLRHTVGFGWHPTTGELWGLDHGSDWRGDDTPPEELNRIVEGAHHGWPYCYDARRVDRLYNADPPGTTKDAFCSTTAAPTLTFQAHYAPMQMAFYTGAQFPAEYRGDAFVAMRGSWNRRPPAGYMVARVEFENGQPVRVTDFVTGWLVGGGSGQWGRITGLAVAADGALLVGDDSNGVIYRVAYEGAAGAP